MAVNENDQQVIAAAYLDDLTKAVISTACASGVAEHLAARVAERQVRDTFIAQLPKRDDLIAATSPVINVSGQSPYPAELSRLQGLIAAKDAFGIIARYPVRQSGILAAVAKALKFQNRADYEAAALTQVSSDQDLRGKLVAKLEPLSTVLDS